MRFDGSTEKLGSSKTGGQEDQAIIEWSCGPPPPVFYVPWSSWSSLWLYPVCHVSPSYVHVLELVQETVHQSVSTVIADLDQLQTQVNDLLAIAADVDDLDPQEKTNLVSSLAKKQNHGQ